MSDKLASGNYRVNAARLVSPALIHLFHIYSTSAAQERVGSGWRGTGPPIGAITY